MPMLLHYLLFLLFFKRIFFFINIFSELYKKLLIGPNNNRKNILNRNILTIENYNRNRDFNRTQLIVGF